MELEHYDIGDVDERDRRNKFCSPIFGSEFFFNIPYTVDVEKYKNALGQKSYVSFENGVKSIVFTFNMWNSTGSDTIHISFFAFSGTDNVETHYDCILKEYEKIPTDDELLNAFKPILDSIIEVNKEDLEQEKKHLIDELHEIENKLSILNKNADK